MKYKLQDISPKFKTIMERERWLRMVYLRMGMASEKKRILDTPKEVYRIVWCLMEMAKSEFVSRSYNSRYGLCHDEFIFESVAAHTNLVSGIATYALDFYYGAGFGESSAGLTLTPDGYSYRNVMEAVRLHDLAENEYGDIPDNGSRDDGKKDRREYEYFKHYIQVHPTTFDQSRYDVLRLLRSMQMKDSMTGKLVFLADKMAALLITLCLDSLDKSPMMPFDSEYASKRDKEEMRLCDYRCNNSYKASEMWALDFFKIRKLVDYDDTFFFTALIAMATLMVNGCWYSWREKEYSTN